MAATLGFPKCFSLNKTQLHENQQKMLDWAAILQRSSLLGSKKSLESLNTVGTVAR
jgi:hypothetical protein